MKNTYKYLLFCLTLVLTFSCEKDATDGKFVEEPTSGWVDFNVNNPAATLAATSTEISIPVEINAPINKEDLTVNFELVEVSGGSPSQVVTTTERSFVIPAGTLETDLVLEVGNILALIEQGTTVEFDVVLLSTDRGSISAGLSDDSQFTNFRVSTPCSVNILDGSVYTGTSSRGGGIVQDDYPVTITDLGNLTYTADTSWGPNFVSVLAGSNAYDGMFAAAITFTVDPVSNTVTVISGGSADGSDNGLGAIYSISGSGTYDTCNDIFEISVTENGIFSDPVSADIIFQMP